MVDRRPSGQAANGKDTVISLQELLSSNAANHVLPANRWPGANRQFGFQKRSQLFIRTHNETLSIAAVCVSNEDCSPAGIHG